MKHIRKSLVICDHLPHKDPRVIWHIMSLRENYAVDVLYLNRTNEILSSGQLISGVRFYSAGRVDTKDNHVEQPQRPAQPQRATPTVPQRAYAIRQSITSPFVYSLYNIFYIPTRWLYRYGRQSRTWMRRLLYGHFGHSHSRSQRRIYNFLVHKVFWLIVLANDLSMLKRTYWSLRDAGSRLSTHYDLIVASDLPTLRMAVHLKRGKQGILIYDAHENWSRVRPGTPNFFAMIVKFYERRLARKADIVTTVSPLLVKHLKESLKNKTVMLLPNAAPLPRGTLEGEFSSDASLGRTIC